MAALAENMHSEYLAEQERLKLAATGGDGVARDLAAHRKRQSQEVMGKAREKAREAMAKRRLKRESSLK